MNDLDERLLKAHDANDLDALVTLYTEAADATSDPVAVGFYLTQAYIYALDRGNPSAASLRARLITLGREE